MSTKSLALANSAGNSLAGREAGAALKLADSKNALDKNRSVQVALIWVSNDSFGLQSVQNYFQYYGRAGISA